MYGRTYVQTIVLGKMIHIGSGSHSEETRKIMKVTTEYMVTTKINFYSVNSTPGARFVTLDVKDFNLNTPMPDPAYMRLKLYNLREEAD